MSTEELTHDPERDPRLAALLAEADPAPAFAPADWERMRARVAESAELPLARLRREERAAPARRLRLRALVPMAAVAGIAAAVLAVTLPGRGEAAPLTPEEEAQLEEIVDASIPENVDLLISGEAAQAELLEAAVGS